MKKFLLSLTAILGLSSQQAGSKTQITLDQLVAPVTPAIMVSIPGRGWVQAQFDSTITLNTATNPPTLSATGSAVPFPTFVDGVTPTGAVDGINTVFTLPSAPNPPASLELTQNGVTQRAGTVTGGDFNLNGATITYAAPPASGGNLLAYYRR